MSKAAATVVVVASLVAVPLVVSAARQTRVPATRPDAVTTSTTAQVSTVDALDSTTTVVGSSATSTTTPAAAAPRAPRPERVPVPGAATSVPQRPEVDGVGPGAWIVRLDGTGLRRISAEGGFMSWSATGDRLALATLGWIWKLPTDASRPAATVATGSDQWLLCMDWSSTGDLAWVTRDGDVRIAPDDGTEGRIAGNGFPDAVECRWSPDGELLAVVGVSSVSIVDRAGSLRQSWSIVTGPPAGNYNTRWLEWSRDGSRVAVLGRKSSDRDEPAALYVWTVGAAVPDGPAFSADGTAGVRHLSWSRQEPDHIYAATGTDGGGELYLIDAGTGAARQLARGCCNRLDALATGRFLAFSPTPANGPRKELRIIDADLATTRRLAFGRGPDPNGSIMQECRGTYFVEKRPSPDEEWVAFRAGAAYGPRCDSPVFN
jgi:hypothetical protein